MNKQIIKNVILVLGAIIITVASIFLPGELMLRENRANLSAIKDVPGEYYSGPSEAIIKNVSKQLTNEECIRLIAGTWESTVEQTNESACRLTEFAVKTLTVNRVEDLYSKGLYPKSIASDFEEWFTWDAIPYRALDTTFQSYAAVFWDVRFNKYDGTEYHRFIVSESGDILYAKMEIGLGVPPDSEVRQKLNSFKPRMSNCLYMLFFYGDLLSYTTLKTASTSDDILGDKTTYTVSSATEEELKNLDTSIASRFIDGYENLETNETFMVRLSNGSNGSDPVRYYVADEKTSDRYSILLLPEYP